MNPTSLSGGGLNEKAAILFRDYDTSQRNCLDHEQLMAALTEFGLLNGTSAKKLGAWGDEPPLIGPANWCCMGIAGMHAWSWRV